MKEILVSGDVTKDFKRLGIKKRETYIGEEFSVCEVTDKEFKILCDEECDELNDTWIDCGWRYAEGSNKGEVNELTLINNKGLQVWMESFRNEEGEEYVLAYNSLLEYFYEYLGITEFRNICALAIDLAKQNDMKLSKLFKEYQG